MHALATELAGDVHGVYLFDLYAEQFFHRFGDLDLIGIVRNLEGLLFVRNTGHGSLGNNRAKDDVLCLFHYAYTSSSFSTALLTMMNLSWFKM